MSYLILRWMARTNPFPNMGGARGIVANPQTSKEIDLGYSFRT